MTNYHSNTHDYHNTEILEKIMAEVKQTPQEYLPNLLEMIRLFRENMTLKLAE